MKKKLRIISGILFILYLAGLAFFLFFSEKYGRNEVESYSYNLVPFAEIKRFIQYREVLGKRSVILNLIGNVIGFLPFGFILPLLFSEVRRLSTVFLLSLEFSLLVECLQLITRVGSFDVDDLILNTFGGLLGGILFFMGKAGYHCFSGHRKGREK